jgi:hypothetical protein
MLVKTQALRQTGAGEQKLCCYRQQLLVLAQINNLFDTGKYYFLSELIFFYY